ncbi:glycosyltransferase family 4 protein [Streptomyces sp. V4I2]|uniref:glycosyltransferase family 4 protein n=1 Tax=Streptomyces sp. V4I2 TaxID=3042280 RepID=UPI002780EECA|nr:glycosyltransferase family 4 protein [Streptomyces sp. V4I2]MDQ1048322.1 glycosyltransferase involved in cell wall biosynthesis [Streptomyces sp. V4I2]
MGQEFGSETAVTRQPRPKLVYVIPHFSVDSAEHFAHIPTLLGALGERVDVLAVVERGHAPESLPGVRTVLNLAKRSRLGRLLEMLRAIRYCARSGYDTYFLRYSRIFVTVLLLSRPFYRHRVLFWRSGMADLVEPGRRVTVRARIDEAVNWLVLRFVDRLVTGPESMVDFMARRWSVPRRRISLLYNDIDTDLFAPLPDAERARTRARFGWGDDEFVVLFVHRLSFRRGTRLLAPLFDSLQAQLEHPVRLVVVGDGPDRTLLEKAATDPGRERMEICGEVCNRELPGVYAAADCFLMPSFEEGFARVLLEAMASALPVVTTDAGGSVDVVGHDYPYRIRVGDLSALAKHVQAIAGLTAVQRRDLGVQLRARASTEFSPQRVARMLEELL